MRLFTSNSKVKQPWVMTWIIVLVICTLTLTSYEYYLKEYGFEASIESNKDLWSWYRSDIYQTNNLVIVGASRSQLDINIPYLKQKLSQYNITQLSINGTYPIATLKALSEDKDFKGILIVSINAQACEKFYFDMQSDYNNYYKNESTIYKSFDAYLTAFLQSKFRFLHPLLGLEKIVNYYEIKKSFLKVFYTTINLDQSVSADYSKTDIEKLVKHFVSEKERNYENQKPTNPRLWIENFSIVRNYVKSIEKHGGKVIFIRFPTDKGHWDLDELYYPRSHYWDKINGVTKVHFKDIKGMGDLDLPDSSHLDAKDSRLFTDLLFDYLIENNYL